MISLGLRDDFPWVADGLRLKKLPDSLNRSPEILKKTNNTNDNTLYHISNTIENHYNFVVAQPLEDITQTNNICLDKLENQKVSDEISGSDHNAIEFAIKLQVKSFSTQYKNARKTDFEGHTSDL